MSIYRTPLKLELNNKKIFSKVEKYRLPFKKDEPIEQKQFKLSRVGTKEMFLITQSVKLPKVKSGNEEEFEKYSQKEEINPQKNQTSSQQIYQKARRIPTEISNRYSSKQSFQENEYPCGSIKKHSKARQVESASGYYSFVEDIRNNNDENTSELKLENINVTPLPKIKEKNYRHNSSLQHEDHQDSISEAQAWNELKNQIHQFKQSKLAQNQSKINKKMTYRNKLSINKQNKMDSNDDIYRQLQPVNQISQDKGETTIDIQNNINESLTLQYKQAIQKLRSLISGENLKRPKKIKRQKFPLQFYVSIYNQIKEVNPFFRKLPELGGCILLKIGKLLIVEGSKYLYYEGQVSKYLYIVIHGKLLLTNKRKTIKKFALNGETLAQYELFEGQKSYIDRLSEPDKISLHQEDAKTLNKTCLLKIAKRKYYKMCRQFGKMGYKNMFNLIDNLFRINYINKMANAHMNLRQKNSFEQNNKNSKSQKKGFFH